MEFQGLGLKRRLKRVGTLQPNIAARYIADLIVYINIRPYPCKTFAREGKHRGPSVCLDTLDYGTREPPV